MAGGSAEESLGRGGGGGGGGGEERRAGKVCKGTSSLHSGWVRVGEGRWMRAQEE